jgi:hypothetical protein
VVSTILIKTMDMMGRDYLRAGLFRERGVRLIAVGDGYDSSLGDDERLPRQKIF